MENTEERRAQMITQAREVITEARRRETFAKTVTYIVAGTLARGLRDQCLSDRDIAEILTVSRNRIGHLVQVGIAPTVGAGIRISDNRATFAAAVAEIYGPVGHTGPGWVQTRKARSGHICAENNVPIPRSYYAPAALDSYGAQFDNQHTGERILVYSLERYNGQPLFDAEGRYVKNDNRGEYCIDFCASTGARQPLPLEILGLTPADVRFGSGWPDPPTNSDDDTDVFRKVTSAVRRHYGIWPLSALSEDPV
ncbi:hypothetical protein BZL29_7835 [Mycobacterium kansasii]|uniref:Uncharacterized protein n=1 Tax=Mycobacterium kansasii TaxID=1768 RepID=A0A1V3WG13_MYCKA|nr:hypothetical protein BZL29_7835 [Mycobacterium kansasii]